MGSFSDFLKTICVPALISLFLYAALSYAIIPFYRKHRQRYAQYLPLETISQHSSSLGSRISRTLARFLCPSAWSEGRFRGGRYSAVGVDGGLFEEEDGEGLVGFVVDTQRQEQLGRSSDIQHSDRRLSRDLEEGFQDESDDEERPDDRRTALQ